ncbi:hypothetical protein F0L74_27215 [Chitinophaga agrisoli]|uniref:Uncharacterized protein n=1 Tax=Chitinophaga agrisoli TaxID=2607653 RepID=A0A5B2VP75_9BACT|nr:hypothetical protein [Chitinophaga agrisoli]KAA2239879.1 hypothetical protein F0L74_27215 [Chitinophaga agrisoli]
MNYIAHLNAFFQRQRNGDNLAPYEFCLYMAIFDLWNTRRFENPFFLDCQRLMTVSGIHSENTYRKYLRSLRDKGYFKYDPGVNFAQVTMIPLQPTPSTNGGPKETSPDNAGGNQCAGTPHETPGNPGKGTQSAPPTDESNYKQCSNRVHKGRRARARKSHAKGSGRKHFKISVRTNLSNDSRSGKQSRSRSFRKVPPPPPTLQEVKDYFKSMNYPANEAEAFFFHYENKYWHTSDGKPVNIWEAVARKWMSGNNNLKKNSNYAPAKNNNKHGGKDYGAY